VHDDGNAACPMSPNAASAQWSTVSVIWQLVMTTVTPRAMPIMSAMPSRSSAPRTNESVSCLRGLGAPPAR
jgi:hypothetical protein